MILELQSILKDFEYSQALEWFSAHVPGKYFVKELLAKGEDPYNRKKLIEELRAIESTLQAQQTEDPPAPSDTPQQTADPKPAAQRTTVHHAADTLDEALLDEAWKPLYKEANHHFTVLGFLKTEAERKEAAFKVLDLMDEVEEIWEKKDFLQRYDQLPSYESQGVEQLSQLDMIKRINTLRTYISKANRGKLSKDKLPGWVAEKEDLERRVSR